MIEEHSDRITELEQVKKRRSYLIATTDTGRRIRYDYDLRQPEPHVNYNYLDYDPKNLFRLYKIEKALTVNQVTSSFKHYSWKQPYNPETYSSQHIVRNTFNEISGQKDMRCLLDYHTS